MNVFQQLQQASGSAWTKYVQHDFIRMLVGATLPLEAFQVFMLQDYLLFKEMVRIYSIAIYKTSNISDAQILVDCLATTIRVANVHKQMLDVYGLSDEGVTPLPTTQIYLQSISDHASSGSICRFLLAKAPCLIGYTEALNVAEPVDLQNHPYSHFIALYSGGDSIKIANKSRQMLSERCADFVSQNFDLVLEIFANSCKLECDFWDMCMHEHSVNSNVCHVKQS